MQRALRRCRSIEQRRRCIDAIDHYIHLFYHRRIHVVFERAERFARRRHAARCGARSERFHDRAKRRRDLIAERRQLRQSRGPYVQAGVERERGERKPAERGDETDGEPRLEPRARRLGEESRNRRFSVRSRESRGRARFLCLQDRSGVRPRSKRSAGRRSAE